MEMISNCTKDACNGFHKSATMKQFLYFGISILFGMVGIGDMKALHGATRILLKGV